MFGEDETVEVVIQPPRNNTTLNVKPIQMQPLPLPDVLNIEAGAARQWVYVGVPPPAFLTLDRDIVAKQLASLKKTIVPPRQTIFPPTEGPLAELHMRFSMVKTVIG